MERPYYTLEIQSAGCQYDVRVNDVSIARDTEGLASTTEYPVSQYVLTGENAVSLRLKARDGGAEFSERSRCRATLFCREDGASQAARERLTSLEFTGAAARTGRGVEPSPDLPDQPPPTAETADDGAVLARRVVTLETPFPQWLWLTAQPLEATPDTRRQLEAVYRQLWGLLRTDQRDALNTLSSVKAQELSAAYYLTPAQARAWVGFEPMLDDPEAVLDELDFDGLELEIFGQGRLAHLADEEGDGPIVFTDKDQTIGRYIRTSFCRTPSGWTLIR